MKNRKRNLITLILTILGSILFYKEDVGLNILLFTLLSALVVAYINWKQEKKRLIYAMAPSLLCSVFMVIYPQSLTYYIWVFTYLIMWSSMATNSFPITVILQGFVSIFDSLFDVLRKTNVRFEKESVSKKPVGIYVISGLIALVFLMLYINSNPVFYDLFSKIDLSYFEFGFISLTFWHFLLLYGLVKIKMNEKIQELNSFENMIVLSGLTPKDEQEFKIANLSLWVVGGILFIVNAIDLIVILTGKLPEGMTYSAFVHQGFNTMIFTLCLAIGLVIYFYRGQLNFHNKIELLKKASVFWIIQNLILSLLTAYKNYLYVEVYGLTYKRIAVFSGLMCVIIGLILSIYKLKKPFTNWFYLNKLAYWAFASIFFISFIPIDKLITDYNLENTQMVDMNYILNLDKADLPCVAVFIKKNGETYSIYSPIVQNKLSILSEKATNTRWQSWNLFIHNYKAK